MKSILTRLILLSIASFASSFSIAQAQSNGGHDRDRRSSERVRHDAINRGNNNRNLPGSNRQRNYRHHSNTINVQSRPSVRQNVNSRPYVVRSYRPPRYTVGVPYYGQRFNRIDHPYVNIAFGGINYQYYGGVFYRPYSGYFQVIAPPFGIRINILPAGYYRFRWRGNPFYYYNGVFYNQYNNYYEVVQPPLGAKLPTLPSGAKSVVINGQRYFENDGTYYVEEYNVNNEVLYTVVGVHGVLDNTLLPSVSSSDDLNNVGPSVNDPALPLSKANITSLPANCKVVEENGQKYYLSPQNIYYQEIVGVDGIVSYQVVNMSTSPNSY